MLARYRGYALEINTAIETPMMLLAFLAPRFLFCFLPADMTLPAYLYGAAIAAVAATSASAIGAHSYSVYFANVCASNSVG